ncbi:MAG: OmpH family outer membrane protein [Bryobacteraceae bacterium]
MKIHALTLPILAVCGALLAPAQTANQPSKVGIINIQQAIVETKDGKKAASELEAKFAPKRKELEKLQAEINAMRDQLQKGANTLSDDAKQRLMRDIDSRTKNFNREAEDAQAELEQEQGRIFQELGQRMMAVLDKYATDNGFAVIMDVSSPQSPVLFAANGINVTQEIVELYDKNSPGAVGAAPAAPKPAAAK